MYHNLVALKIWLAQATFETPLTLKDSLRQGVLGKLATLKINKQNTVPIPKLKTVSTKRHTLFCFD
jgi:hypothetical protein